ncbi:DASH complex subunit ask1 [Recurvomyces mirabilis]|nr:DASH complex subunit ask1 [Recurvomyces mirabilis]
MVAQQELERLEQQITLTLQEIDSNFSKAHRIVTSSILPTVEQYAKHSGDVWEGSKFWKHFFEASANVSLSGYEEPEDLTHTETSVSLETPEQHGQDASPGALAGEDDDEEFTIDSPTQVTGVQSTPKLSASTSRTAKSGRKAVSYRSPSPRKYTGKTPMAMPLSPEEPSTPRAHQDVYPQSSPFQPESAYQPSALRHNNDPLLHRVLDKSYRVQATPHTQRRQKQPATKPTPATATKTAPWDDSPNSSPAMAAPQLRSDLFSPAKAPRTPGVSVLTPARGKSGRPAPTTSTGRQLFSPQDKAYTASKERTSYTFNDDSDEEELEMSPPKTMQFHVPQSRLMQTPAREASRKIVEDLLLTAGADATDEIEADGEGLEEASPSVIRLAFDVDDDTF